MAFNLGGAISGGLAGLSTGNPWIAGAAALAGGLTPEQQQAKNAYAGVSAPVLKEYMAHLESSGKPEEAQQIGRAHV